ncbi:MAG: DUF262 domain-containing protein [Quinella sp. 2Q5]|nr:DUF262 domain-containing protein [Quinella sp. 2Q5]
MKPHSFDLVDLMRRIDGGELQIPDFRRDWVWSDEQIKSLVEGVVRGFPINSVMLLECGASTKFSCRPITGVTAAAAPSCLVLDGQQRLTSLFGALQSSTPDKEYAADVNEFTAVCAACCNDLSSDGSKLPNMLDDTLQLRDIFLPPFGRSGFYG